MILRPWIIFSFMAFFISRSHAQLTWQLIEPINETLISASSFEVDWDEDDFIVLKSKDDQIVGLFEVESKEKKQLRLITIRSTRIPQHMDFFEEMDLREDVVNLPSTTYIWQYDKLSRGVKSYYKPLFTQGTTIGDTAHTLYKNEKLLTALGTYAYGVHPAVTLSTNIPAIIIGSPNFRIKGRVYKSEKSTWAVGATLAQNRNSSEKILNMDLIWDSVLSDKLIAHSIITAAVVSFDEARDIAAVKSYGNSSVQTGYEYLFSNWSRLLMGPSYNVEQEAIGGYIGYIRIWDKLHLQISLSTNNIRELKLSAQEGYLTFIDTYWRW